MSNLVVAATVIEDGRTERKMTITSFLKHVVYFVPVVPA